MSDISQWVQVYGTCDKTLSIKFNSVKVGSIFGYHAHVEEAMGYVNDSGLFLDVILVNENAEKVSRKFQYTGTQDPAYLLNYLRTDPPKISKPEDFIMALLVGGRNGHF